MKKAVLLSVFALTSVTCFGNPVVTGDSKPSDEATVSLQKTAVDKVREIPLNCIWAYNMPGTRDVRELEPAKFGAKVAKLSSAQRLRLDRESLTSQILASLPHLPSYKHERPKAGFAVQGKRESALHMANGVLAAKHRSFHSFPPGSDITVVFFGHSSGVYVHLRRVELREHTLRIVYQFVEHPNNMLTTHFALIPLGKLPPGIVTVEMLQSPDEQADNAHEKPVWLASEAAHRIVCDSFTFAINEKAEPK